MTIEVMNLKYVLCPLCRTECTGCCDWDLVQELAAAVRAVLFPGLISIDEVVERYQRLRDALREFEEVFG